MRKFSKLHKRPTWRARRCAASAGNSGTSRPAVIASGIIDRGMMGYRTPYIDRLTLQATFRIDASVSID
jgi:hypothetical protein